MRFAICALISCLLAAPAAMARPVSYPDGWMVMLMNDANSNALQLNYTVTRHYALGFQHEYFRDEKFNMDAATLDILAKRWNLPGSQANLFIKSGIGIAYENGEQDPAAYTGFEIDWENRRLFTLYENRFFTAGDMEKFAAHKARIGVAPYIADAGKLHTWLMLQADYTPGDEDGNFSVTPLVRLFKGTSLLEAGYSSDNTVLFNFTQQF